MNSWQTKKLGELSKVQTGPFGAQLHEKDYVKTNGTPIITVENLSGGIVKLLPSTPLVSGEDKARLHRYVLREGDIVFSRVGSVDRSAYVTANADGWMFSGRLLRVHPSEKLDAKYLNYHLNDERTKNLIRNLAVGGTMPSLNTEILNFVPIHFPEKAEQERIVGVLEVWDEYIKKLEQKIALSEQLQKGLIQIMLNGKKKLSSDTGEWSVIKLKDLTKPVSNRNREKLHTRVLSVTNKRGFILPSEQFTKVVASADLSNYKIVKKGQFAYNPSRLNVGSIDLLEKYEDGVLSPMYVVFETTSRLLPQYLKYWLKTARSKASIRNAASGSVRESVDYKDFGSIAINIPEKNSQEAIVKVIRSIESEIHGLKNIKNYYGNQKEYLLKNLITGTIRTPEDLKPLVQSGVKS